MNEHHRDVAMSAATSEMADWVRPWIERHNLSAVEYLRIMINFTQVAMSQLAAHERKSMLADEAKLAEDERIAAAVAAESRR